MRDQPGTLRRPGYPNKSGKHSNSVTPWRKGELSGEQLLLDPSPGIEVAVAIPVCYGS